MLPPTGLLSGDNGKVVMPAMIKQGVLWSNSNHIIMAAGISCCFSIYRSLYCRTAISQHTLQ